MDEQQSDVLGSSFLYNNCLSPAMARQSPPESGTCQLFVHGTEFLRYQERHSAKHVFFFPAAWSLDAHPRDGETDDYEAHTSMWYRVEYDASSWKTVSAVSHEAVWRRHVAMVAGACRYAAVVSKAQTAKIH